MDIFVFPSYREGFGMVVIEAEAMEIPVVVSDIPGPTDAVVPNLTGLVVPKGSSDAIVEAVTLLAEDPCRRERMGAAGRAFVRERFDRQTLMRRYLEDKEALLSAVGQGRR